MENLQSLSEEVLAGALQTFVQEGTKLLNAVSADAVSNSDEDFLETKVNKLMDSIPIICSLMERKQLEDLWKRYKYSTMQKCVDEALSFEVEWDNFLKMYDEKKLVEPCTQGSSAEQLPRKGIPSAARNAAPSCLSTMTRARGTAAGSPGRLPYSLLHEHGHLVTGPPPHTSLRAQTIIWKESKLDGVPLRVVLITFCQQGALHWLQETMCPYDMLLDPHKKLYDAFGLGRSLFAVWNIQSMFCYAEHILAGQTLPKSSSPVKEDLHQLGGDFVLDQTGKVIVHRSLRRSWDRPTANEIVKALK